MSMILVIFFISCDNQIRLDKIKTEQLKFDELPETVKLTYLRTLFKSSGECLGCYNGPKLICLDKQNCTSSINPDCGGPLTTCVDYLIIQGEKFELVDGYGKYSSPWVLYKNKLYFFDRHNHVISEKRNWNVSSQIYGYWNLKEYLIK